MPKLSEREDRIRTRRGRSQSFTASIPPLQGDLQDPNVLSPGLTRLAGLMGPRRTPDCPSLRTFSTNPHHFYSVEMMNLYGSLEALVKASRPGTSSVDLDDRMRKPQHIGT